MKPTHEMTEAEWQAHQYNNMRAVSQDELYERNRANLPLMAGTNNYANPGMQNVARQWQHDATQYRQQYARELGVKPPDTKDFMGPFLWGTLCGVVGSQLAFGILWGIWQMAGPK